MGDQGEARRLAEDIVCFWVNKRQDRSAREVARLSLGRRIPEVCPDLIDRITEALVAERQRHEAELMRYRAVTAETIGRVILAAQHE